MNYYQTQIISNIVKFYLRDIEFALIMALLTFYWSLDYLIFSIAVIIGSYVYATRNFNYWRKRDVMEIPPTPFIGNVANFLFMKSSPGELLKDLYNQSANQPYVGFYIFDRPFFLLRDPELIKAVILRDFNYFEDRFATAHDALGAPALFFVNNPKWRLLRTKLTPSFTSSKLKKMFELMLEVSDNLKTHLNSLDLEREGRIMEIKELCAKYATDVIGSAAFGLNTNCLMNPDSEFRKQGREMLRFTIWRCMAVMSALFAPQYMKLMGFDVMPPKVVEFVRRIFWDVMGEREQSGLKRNDLIDRLMELKKTEADSSDKEIFEFDGDNLVAQASSLFGAGFETVSTAISFTLYELALAPDIQTKLRHEIKDAIKNHNGEITFDLVLNLPYLDMVVSETLRKYPSLSYLDRVTNADYTVPNSNLVLKKGTPVYIPLLGLHYDPQYFPDPKVYDPERFSEENKRDRKTCVYMPFGDGPRNCIGMRFALLEAKLAIIYILSEYELSPCAKTLIPMRFDPKALLLAADGGLYLKIRKIITADD